MEFTNACTYSGSSGKNTCMSEDTAKLILAKKDQIKSLKPEKIEKILSNGKTVDELNLLLNKEIISLLGKDKVKNELDNFKPVGPATSTELFNNFVENNVKHHLEKFDKGFKSVPVQLMDFPEPGYTFNTELVNFKDNIPDIKNGTLKTFGCVLNTLKSTGNLSAIGHWVAMFGDFRKEPYTIEYFNSSGSNAPAAVFKWMKNLAAEIEKETGTKTIALNTSNIVHQKSDTECGAYALYYICARLSGYPYKKFREKPIRDDVMIRFRSAALNPEDKIENKDFLKNLYLI